MKNYIFTKWLQMICKFNAFEDFNWLHFDSFLKIDKQVSNIAKFCFNYSKDALLSNKISTSPVA